MTLGKQGELVRVIQLFTQELQKEEYRLARQNYRKKCIELTVKYYVKYNKHIMHYI